MFNPPFRTTRRVGRAQRGEAHLIKRSSYLAKTTGLTVALHASWIKPDFGGPHAAKRGVRPTLRFVIYAADP